MKQEKLEKLVNELTDKLEAINLSVNIEIDNDDFEINITGSFQDAEFSNYLKDLDDDIFTEACERFESETGIPLNEFVHKVNPELFKRVVSKICQEKISKFTKYI